MPSKKAKKISKKVGSGLAQVQSFMDDVFVIACKSLKKAGKEESSKVEPQTIQEKGVHLAKQSAKFVGEVGESFYSRYEEIKSEKQKRKKSSKKNS